MRVSLSMGDQSKDNTPVSITGVMVMNSKSYPGNYEGVSASKTESLHAPS